MKQTKKAHLPDEAGIKQISGWHRFYAWTRSEESLQIATRPFSREKRDQGDGDLLGLFLYSLVNVLTNHLACTIVSLVACVPQAMEIHHYQMPPMKTQPHSPPSR